MTAVNQQAGDSLYRAFAFRLHKVIFDLICAVLEESGVDVETLVSLMVEEITTADVASGGSVLAELVIPISVTAVILEE